VVGGRYFYVKYQDYTGEDAAEVWLTMLRLALGSGR